MYRKKYYQEAYWQKYKVMHKTTAKSTTSEFTIWQRIVTS